MYHVDGQQQVQAKGDSSSEDMKMEVEADHTASASLTEGIYVENHRYEPQKHDPNAVVGNGDSLGRDVYGQRINTEPAGPLPPPPALALGMSMGTHQHMASHPACSSAKPASRLRPKVSSNKSLSTAETADITLSSAVSPVSPVSSHDKTSSAPHSAKGVRQRKIISRMSRLGRTNSHSDLLKAQAAEKQSVEADRNHPTVPQGSMSGGAQKLEPMQEEQAKEAHQAQQHEEVELLPSPIPRPLQVMAHTNYAPKPPDKTKDGKVGTDGRTISSTPSPRPGSAPSMQHPYAPSGWQMSVASSGHSVISDNTGSTASSQNDSNDRKGNRRRKLASHSPMTSLPSSPNFAATPSQNLYLPPQHMAPPFVFGPGGYPFGMAGRVSPYPPSPLIFGRGLPQDQPNGMDINTMLTPSPQSECVHCVEMERHLLAMQSDLQYLRNMALKNEFVCTECASHQSGNAVSCSSSIASGKQSTASERSRKKRAAAAAAAAGNDPDKFQESAALAEASQRLMEVTERHKIQIEQMTRETARWQNDMHLKMSKLSIMCKDLNEESAKRKEEARAVRAELSGVRSERNALATEVELLRVKVGVFEKQEEENTRVRDMLRDGDNEILNKTDAAIRQRDSLIADLTVRLQKALDTLEIERDQKRHQGDIIFQAQRQATPVGASSMGPDSIHQEKSTNEAAETLMQLNEQLVLAKKKTNEAQSSLDAAKAQAARNESSLQAQCDELARELLVAEEKLKGANINCDGSDD